jgi:hypothetical protein
MKSRHVPEFTGDVTPTRRECLGAVAAVVTLAGCSTSSDTPTDERSGTGTPSAGLYRHGENLYSTSPNVEIHSIEARNSGPNTGIFGVVENVGDRVLDLVRANAYFYDGEEQRIDTGVATRSYLHPSKEWSFEAPFVKGANTFSSFRLIVFVPSS